jgi:hypothetical protein
LEVLYGLPDLVVVEEVLHDGEEASELLDGGEARAAPGDGVMQEQLDLAVSSWFSRRALCTCSAILSTCCLRKPSMSIVLLHWSSSGTALNGPATRARLGCRRPHRHP